MVVPEAFENVPLSTESCTIFTETVSEAVPVMFKVPETVAPFAGELMATAAAGFTTLMLKLLDAVCAAASFTSAVKGNEPRTEGVPLIEPDEFSERPVGREPLESNHVYGIVPPEAASVALYAPDRVAPGSCVVVTCKVAEGGGVPLLGVNATTTQ